MINKVEYLKVKKVTLMGLLHFYRTLHHRIEQSKWTLIKCTQVTLDCGEFNVAMFLDSELYNMLPV